MFPKASARKAFETALSKAQIDDFTFHDLRHSFASHYVMRDGKLPALQQILGHATLAMTMRYSHLSPSHLRDEMSKTERASRDVNSIPLVRATDPGSFVEPSGATGSRGVALREPNAGATDPIEVGHAS